MFKNFKIYPWYLSIWFWYVLTTVVYVAFQFQSGLEMQPWSLLALLGMFVPIGLLSAFYGGFTDVSFLTRHVYYIVGSEMTAKIISSFIVIIILIILLSLGNRVASYFGVKETPFSKIVFNLLYLLFVTLVIDLIIWGTWPSLFILVGYQFFHCC